jgi:hypothetical protein
MTGHSDGGEVVGTGRLLLDLRARWWAFLRRGVTAFGDLVAHLGRFRSESAMPIALTSHRTAYGAASTSSKTRT